MTTPVASLCGVFPQFELKNFKIHIFCQHWFHGKTITSFQDTILLLYIVVTLDDLRI